jgi:hypothetical protein
MLISAMLDSPVLNLMFYRDKRPNQKIRLALGDIICLESQICVCVGVETGKCCIYKGLRILIKRELKDFEKIR